MLRSTFMLVLGAATLLAGCGKSSPTTSSYNQLSHVSTTTTSANPYAQPIAQGVTPSAAPIATGTFALGLSSLKDASGAIAAIDVSLSGPGLDQPLTKRLAPTDFATSNTLSFDHIPATTLTATLTAVDKNESPIGTKTTTVTVAPSGNTKLQLALTAAPFSFSVVDPNAILAPATTGSTTGSGAGSTTDTGTTGVNAQTSTTGAAADGALGVEILSKDTVRQYLLFKRLSVTLRVTNHNPTESLNGQVIVDFHKMKGIFTKTDAVVQTLTQAVSSLAPGKTVDITLQSTTSADDAVATVHTVLASNSTAGN